MSWDNNAINVKQLRMKCIALLALTIMLRPSDIAPKAMYVDEDDELHSYIFTEDQINFKTDGTMSITIHGNKNDSKRNGFIVDVPNSSDVNVCPVQAIKDYISRTSKYRKLNSPVFISVRKPYAALSSQSIRNILNEAIETVGLSRSLYSAKCFRPTGATQAVAAGVNPDTVMKIGRWKTASVFYEHYVHGRTPKDFTDKILKL